MIKLAITEEDLQEARELSEVFGCNNSYSMFKDNEIKSKEVNLTGMLGEVLFQKLFPNAIRSNNVNYDFILNGHTIDVKSKIVNSVPRPDFVASVFKYSYEKQQNDYYVFMRIDKSLKVGYYLGMIGKKDFLDKAVLFRKGEDTTNNRFVYQKDTYNVFLNQLHIPESVKLRGNKLNV